MAHYWGGKMIDALKAVCELQLERQARPKLVCGFTYTCKFTDGAIPDFEAIFAGVPKARQDEIHDVLVHKSKPGIVQIAVEFEIEKRDGTMEPCFPLFLLEALFQHPSHGIVPGPNQGDR